MLCELHHAIKGYPQYFRVLADWDLCAFDGDLGICADFFEPYEEDGGLFFSETGQVFVFLTTHLPQRGTCLSCLIVHRQRMLLG